MEAPLPAGQETAQELAGPLAPGAPFLVELVDRQFAFLASRDGDRLLMSISRALSLFEGEPTLAAILREFDAEAAAAVARYVAHERALMAELAELWGQHGERFLAHAGAVGFDREALEGFPRSLVPLEHLEYPVNEEPRWDRASSRHRLSKLRYWVTAARERAPALADRVILLNLEEHLGRLRERHEVAFREYRTFGVTLPGAARARLAWATGCLNPGLLQTASDAARPVALDEAREREDLAEMLHEPTKRRLLTGGPGTEMLAQARRDALLLREELVLALGRARAGVGRLAHFAEKMARFHAAGLAKAFSGRALRGAELELAMALAEHFFEGGISAAADASELDRATLFVQAKYLAKPTPAKAQAAIAAAHQALLGARARTGATRGVLLLVQREGARLVLPAEVRVDGASLLLGALHVGAGRRASRKELHVPSPPPRRR